MSEKNLLQKTVARRDWARARQRAAIEGIVSLVMFHSQDLLSFEEAQKRLRLSHKSYRGIQDIEVDRIVGSVGRYRDFTRTFLPRKEALRERWERVNVVVSTKGAEPIQVYQVGEAYFVLDGNHRVSIARQNQWPTIEAHVWEYQTPAPLSADADLDELFVKTEYLEFLERTQLDKLRPDHGIEFTTPGRYRELEYQIALYRQVLEQIDQEDVSFEDAVTAWYDMVYTPAIQIIREKDLLKYFPGRTEADLFIWVWRYNQELRRHTGVASIASAAEGVANLSLRRQLSALWERLVGWLKPGSAEDATS